VQSKYAGGGRPAHILDSKATFAVTARRWLAFCNPELSALITETLGTDEWTLDMGLLRGLEKHADDPAFRAKWRDIKRVKKAKLAAKIKAVTGDNVNLDAMFDIHVRTPPSDLPSCKPNFCTRWTPRVHQGGAQEASRELWLPVPSACPPVPHPGRIGGDPPPCDRLPSRVRASYPAHVRPRHTRPACLC
jgi:Carbohydrate phosphorylase